MIVYALRNKITGKYLRDPRGRGGSFLECDSDRPRLHHTKQGAQNTLTAWLMGHHERHYTGPNIFDPGGDDFVKVIVQPHRKRDEMEIVRFRLTEITAAR